MNLSSIIAARHRATAGFSTEAQNYFDRLDTAGDTTYTPYKQPLANYIDGLVTLGGAYWDTMLSSTSFVGVGIQGITVPLRDGMTVPTQNNFVAADLNQSTGLKGDASTKYITTGVLSSTLGINNHSLSVYLTADREAGAKRYISGANAKLTLLGNVTGFKTRSASATLYTLGSSTAVGELVGISRDNASDFDWSYETSGTQLNTSTDSGSNIDIKVFAGEDGNNATAARLATYHIGPALNLATLEGLQDILLSEVAAAAAPESYFSRLAAAGDTTHVAYKQPLTNYISSLVALGGAYWDDMLSACSFVGVGIEGITVPLREGMTVPTQNNFVAADLNQLTGLKGNLSSKWIDTNIGGQTPDQDDNSISTYATEVNTYNRYYLATGAALGATHIYPVSSTNLTCRISGGGSGVNATPLHFAGATRSAASVMNTRANGTDFPNTTTSVQQLTTNFNVFGRPNANRTDARLATYHIGPALNLATLEGLQDTLISEIAAI